MNEKERKSCIHTIKTLMNLAYNIHGVMDVVDVDNCKKIIEMLDSGYLAGRWIPCPQNASWLYVYKCSECGGYLQISDVDGIGITAKYCPYCGAKMEGGEKE